MASLPFQTTDTPARKTLSEIRELLYKFNATNILETVNSEYQAPDILMFTLNIPLSGGGERTLPFKLPARIESVATIIKDGIKRKPRFRNDIEKRAFDKKIWEQASKVAWRILFHWLKAQLAIYQTNMVQVHEIFMPYLSLKSGDTLANHFLKAENFKLLEGKIANTTT